MWVLTPRGFYSVVEHREHGGNVIVRAREEADLLRLMDFASAPEMLQIEETPKADYPVRLHMARTEWIAMLAEMGEEITYDNFKNAVKKVNPERALTYMGVWSRLRNIEREGRTSEEYDQLDFDELQYGLPAPDAPKHPPLVDRTVAWVSHHDRSGYTRLHKIEIPEGQTVLDAYRDGLLLHTKCGIRLPDSVVDITERTNTLRCGRCFR